MSYDKSLYCFENIINFEIQHEIEQLINLGEYENLNAKDYLVKMIN